MKIYFLFEIFFNLEVLYVKDVFEKKMYLFFLVSKQGDQGMEESRNFKVFVQVELVGGSIEYILRYKLISLQLLMR